MKIYRKPFNEDIDFDVPIFPHPGAFKSIRKNEIHTGVDLYVPNGTSVFPIENGKIVNIVAFTGEHAGLPWWNNTWAVLIKGRTGVIVYGEIKPEENISIGDEVCRDKTIGKVIPVIKNIKETTISPSMLHLELLDHDRTNEAPMISPEEDFPSFIHDPTNLLIQLK